MTIGRTSKIFKDSKVPSSAIYMYLGRRSVMRRSLIIFVLETKTAKTKMCQLYSYFSNLTHVLRFNIN